MYIDRSVRASSLAIQITDQEKYKGFLYNNIELVTSYIKIITSFDSPLTKKHPMGTILKESVIIEVNEAITNEEKIQKDGKVEIKNLCQ